MTYRQCRVVHVDIIKAILKPETRYLVQCTAHQTVDCLTRIKWVYKLWAGWHHGTAGELPAAHLEWLLTRVVYTMQLKPLLS